MSPRDRRKIGRRSSSGCIGLYTEQIVPLFALTTIAMQVLLTLKSGAIVRIL
tara:strand:- start:1943 stop:2098 length:156 start_codon:yes stop_codon:yes gene_type:complete